MAYVHLYPTALSHVHVHQAILGIYASRIHVSQALAKMVPIVHLYLIAHIHAHVRIILLETFVSRILAF